MLEQLFFTFVDNCFDLTDRHIEFFSKLFVDYAVQKSALQDFAVSFCISANYPFVNSGINVRPAYFLRFLILPEP